MDIQTLAALVAAGVIVLAVLGVGVTQLLKLVRRPTDHGPQRRFEDQMRIMTDALGGAQQWRGEVTKSLEAIARESIEQTRDLARHRLELVTEMRDIRQQLDRQDQMLGLLSIRTTGHEKIPDALGAISHNVDELVRNTRRSS